MVVIIILAYGITVSLLFVFLVSLKLLIINIIRPIIIMIIIITIDVSAYKLLSVFILSTA